LDADIKSFFDEIDHNAILNRTPVFRRVIEGWLKAGVFTGDMFDPTEMGTPQGGVASPLLANIALHGLEDLFHEWSLVGGHKFLCETVQTFSEPPSGYRKCRPENCEEKPALRPGPCTGWHEHEQGKKHRHGHQASNQAALVDSFPWLILVVGGNHGSPTWAAHHTAFSQGQALSANQFLN
jgi:hypothetical protein